MKRKEIEFNAEDLVSNVEALSRHAGGTAKLTLRTKTLVLPVPIKPIKAKDIVAIRERLAVSQAVFASLLNTSVSTVQKWEVGQKRPSGTALKLLHLVKKRGLEIIAF